MSPEVLYFLHSRYPNLHPWSLVLGLLGFLCIINWRAESVVLITLVSLGIVWAICYHARFSVELLPNSVDNDYFVIGSSRMRHPPSTSFLERRLQPLSQSYAMLRAKDRNGTLTLWGKSDAHANLTAGVGVLFSPALLDLLLLGKTVLCAPTRPSVAFDLSLWIAVMFLEEEVVYKEARKARGVLRLKP